MRSAHRERASGARQNEVQDEAKDNSSGNFTDAQHHVIEKAGCGDFKRVLQTALPLQREWELGQNADTQKRKSRLIHKSVIRKCLILVGGIGFEPMTPAV